MLEVYKEKSGELDVITLAIVNYVTRRKTFILSKVERADSEAFSAALQELISTGRHVTCIEVSIVCMEIAVAEYLEFIKRKKLIIKKCYKFHCFFFF